MPAIKRVSLGQCGFVLVGRKGIRWPRQYRPGPLNRARLTRSVQRAVKDGKAKFFPHPSHCLWRADFD